MRKYIFVILLLCLPAWSQTATITGKVVDPSTANQSVNTYVQMTLTGCAGNQPRYNGVAQIWPVVKKYYTNASGNVSDTIYRNDYITCGISTASNKWQMIVVQDGQAGPACDVRITSGTFDATQPNCLNVSPTVPAPTDATVYAKLDASNTPFTGNVGFTAQANLTNTGIFTNTQQNDYLTSIINSLNVGSEYSSQQAGNFATDAGVGAIAVPSSSTVHQANGLTGIVTNASTATASVGVFGQARATATNAPIWGGNFVAADTATTGATSSLNGIEVDCNVSNTATQPSCIAANGAWYAQPAVNAFGFQLAKPIAKTGGPYFWNSGLYSQVGAVAAPSSSGATVYFNAVAAGTNQVSQGMTFISNDPTPGTHTFTQNEDASGNLVFTAPGKLFKFNADGSLTVPNSVASLGGTVALATGALASNTCAAPATVAISGVTSSSVIVWSFASDTTGIVGYGNGATGPLSVTAFPTANTANIRVCNLNASSITPGTMSVNVRAIN